MKGDYWHRSSIHLFSYTDIRCINLYECPTQNVQYQTTFTVIGIVWFSCCFVWNNSQFTRWQLPLNHRGRIWTMEEETELSHRLILMTMITSKRTLFAYVLSNPHCMWKPVYSSSKTEVVYFHKFLCTHTLISLGQFHRKQTTISFHAWTLCVEVSEFFSLGITVNAKFPVCRFRRYIYTLYSTLYKPPKVHALYFDAEDSFTLTTFRIRRT